MYLWVEFLGHRFLQPNPGSDISSLLIPVLSAPLDRFWKIMHLLITAIIKIWNILNIHKVFFSILLDICQEVEILMHVWAHVQLFATLWTITHQAPLSIKFFRKEYWSGLPFPTPGDLPYPGVKSVSLVSPELAGGFFNTGIPGKHSHESSRSYGNSI